MALNDSIRGAIAPDILPFSLYETRSADLAEHDKQLGQRYALPGGLAAVLVEAAGVIPLTTIGGQCLKWSDTVNYTVVVTAAAGDEACGVTLPGLEACVAGDKLLMVIPTQPDARVALIDAGAGSAAGAFLQPTAAGEVVTDATFDHANPGTSFARALEIGAADGVQTCILILGQFGGNVA